MFFRLFNILILKIIFLIKNIILMQFQAKKHLKTITIVFPNTLSVSFVLWCMIVFKSIFNAIPSKKTLKNNHYRISKHP
jgi:uncharacterized PurR-regulated membrane protein YhhQ (DUF165 family)